MYRYNLSFRCDGNILEIDESDDKKSLEETIKALNLLANENNTRLEYEATVQLAVIQ